MQLASATAAARMDAAMSLRNLLRQPRRSAIAIGAVGAGIVALMLAGGFIEWIYHDFRESTIRAHLGHLQIVRPGWHDAGHSDPFRYLLPPGDRIPSEISRERGVRVVAPRLFFSGLAAHGDTTLSFIGEGGSPAAESELSRSLTIVEGRALREGERDGVLFGLGLARNLGVKVGDRVTLLVTTASGGTNGADVEVRGTFRTVTKAYDDAALRVSIDTARSLLRVNGAHAYVALLDDTARTSEAAKSLEARLVQDKLQVVRWFELADFYNRTVELFDKQVTVVRVIIAAIILLSITNTMMMVVMERTGEIGTSLALGVSRKRVLGSLVFEGGLLGLVGGCIGLVIGYVLAAYFSHVGIPMPPPPGMEHGFVGEILITPSLAAGSFAIAVVTAIVASLYPSWRASRLPIVDALRHNR